MAAPGDKLGLVLSGGGARGAYQSGVLKALAEKIGGSDPSPFPIVTGVSAGALNSANLASHRGSFREAADALVAGWSELTIERVYKSDFKALFGSVLKWVGMVGTGSAAMAKEARGMLDTAPLAKSLAGAIDLSGLGPNIADGRIRALALSATDYSMGGTVTFVQGHPDVEPWERAGRRSIVTDLTIDHVMASCALPLIFPAVRVGDTYYGDGSVRQRVPLSPAIHLGADRLLVITISHKRTADEPAIKPITDYPVPSQVIGMLLNAIFLDSLDADIERAIRVNRTLEMLPIGVPHPDGLRPISLMKIAPSKDLGELSQDLGRALPRSMRLLLRGLGGRLAKSPDFLSYLLFEKPYLERLIELGYRDGLAEWDRVGPFLEGVGATVPGR